MSDIFEEVGEDLRRDQLKGLWQRYNGLVIGAALLIVAATAGYEGYGYWAAKKAATAGDAFSELLAGAKAGDHAALAEDLAVFQSKTTPSYALLARFRAASEHAAMGETDNAIAAFTDLSKDSAAPVEMRNLAAIRAAMVALDSESEDAIKARLAPFDSDISPWRHAAREMLALAAYKAGDLKTAGDIVGRMTADPSTPADVKSRARILQAMVVSKSGDDGESQ